MKLNTYTSPADFLVKVQPALEIREDANNLILGISLRLERNPDRIEIHPCLKIVEDADGPVLSAIITPPHKLLLSHHRGDFDKAAALLIENVISEEWNPPGILGPDTTADKASKIWFDITGQKSEIEYRMQIFKIDKVTLPAPKKNRFRPADPSELDLLSNWAYDFNFGIFGEADRESSRKMIQSSIEQKSIYVWDDNGPVSVVMKSRPTRNGVCLSMAYTPPDLRNRGYATACVGEMARMLLESGRKFCVLFVNTSNTSAIRAYQKVGFRPLCNFNEYIFLK